MASVPAGRRREAERRCVMFWAPQHQASEAYAHLAREGFSSRS